MPNIVANCAIFHGKADNITRLHSFVRDSSEEDVREHLQLTIASRVESIPGHVTQVSPTQVKLFFTSAWEPPSESLRRICQLYDLNCENWSIDTDQYPEEKGCRLRLSCNGPSVDSSVQVSARYIAQIHFPTFYQQQAETEPLDRVYDAVRRAMDSYVVAEHDDDREYAHVGQHSLLPSNSGPGKVMVDINGQVKRNHALHVTSAESKQAPILMVLEAQPMKSASGNGALHAFADDGAVIQRHAPEWSVMMEHLKAITQQQLLAQNVQPSSFEIYTNSKQVMVCYWPTSTSLPSK